MTNRDRILLRRMISKSFNSFKPYPSMQPAIQLTTGAGAYELGDFAEIVPADAITDNFTVSKVQFAVLSATGTYEVVLYKGESENEEEIGRTRIAGGTNGNVVLNIDMATPVLEAGTRISAKIAYAAGGAETLYMSVIYQFIVD